MVAVTRLEKLIPFALVALLAGPATAQRASAAAKPPAAKTTATKPTAKDKPAKAKKNPNRREIGVLPAISFSTDIGFGLGAILSWTKFKPGYFPFRYRIQALAFFTLKSGANGITAPFHSDYVQLDVPDLFNKRLRLNVQLAFARFTNVGYYGLGNAAGNKNPFKGIDPGRAERYFRYVRTYPSLTARARIHLDNRRQLSLLVGAGVTYNAFSSCDHEDDLPCPYTKLEEDKRRVSVDRDLERALRGTQDHLLPTAIAGLVFDTRDDIFSPTRGVFVEGTVRGSPRPDLVFGGVNFTARAYKAIWGKRRLVVAGRLMADMLFGQVPFYELARYGGLFPGFGIGAATAVRGVPLGRFHGRIKLIGNLELRAQFLPFTIFGQRFNLGAIAFVDAGRVFTDYRAIERLDGSGAGIKVGVGGGVRLRWGDAFVIRGDVAWSRDAEPIGIYIDVGHIF